MRRKMLRNSYLWGVVITILIGFMGIAFGIITGTTSENTRSAEAQGATVPFSHQMHVQEVNIDCQFCHSEARRAPQAGLPSLSKCMTCHEYFTVASEEGQQQINQLLDAIANEQPPQWPDVYRQPDFVYFSHRPHVTEGVSCNTCHGDVQNMDFVEQQIDMTMGFCLDCHNDPPPNDPEADQTRLIDCNTCHK